MPRCLIGLGGNLGTSQTLFEAALRKLERSAIRLVRMSQVIRTRPVGANAGEEFLNAAATLDCRLKPDKFLSALHEVESDFGRTRSLYWGPRSLDLDLLLFDQQVHDRPDLVIPHPAMWYRRFVLDPAVEIADEMIHPILKQTVSELQRELQKRPIRLFVFPGDGHVAEILDLNQILHSVAAAVEDVEWILSDDPSRNLDGSFAGVMVYGPTAVSTRRLQPTNSDLRQLTIHAGTDDSAIDQLTQLSAAILG